MPLALLLTNDSHIVVASLKPVFLRGLRSPSIEAAMPLDNEPRIISSQRDATGNVDTYKSALVDVEYFDGIAQMTVNASLSRLDLFTIRGSENKDGADIQIREVTKSISVPTIELFAFILNSFEGVLNNREILSGALNTTFDNFDKVLARLKEDPKP